MIATRKAEQALLRANEFVLFKYPLGLTGTTPHRVIIHEREWVWAVPVILTSPGYGSVGEVGMVLVDEEARTIVGYTPHDEVASAIKRLREDKSIEIEAAFLRARKI